MGNRSGFAPEEFYHLYNRGTEKRNIFVTDGDYERFTTLLYLCNGKKQVRMSEIFPRGSTSCNFSWEIIKEFDRGETLVDICAYCLMPNHFHFLVREKEGGNTSRFMQKLMTGYTMYFNERHERNGTLFQGTFKSSHADEDRYLKYLISYIHLNPVKIIDPRWKENGIKDRRLAEKFLRQYRHSSYLDYLAARGARGLTSCRASNWILNKEVAMDYFGTARDFKTDIADWLEYQEEL